MQLKLKLDSIIYGDQKLSKAAIKSADNSTCLHSDSFEINTDKYQVNESFLVSELRETVFFRV